MRNLYNAICRFDTQRVRILSLSIILSFNGLFLLIPSVKTGLPIIAVISGLMIGTGLGLCYLAVQWDKKTTTNIVLSVFIASSSTAVISLLFLATQGNL
ncbi:hypothetical protein ACN08Z_00210 [Rothia sp. P7181]|uniref:hypothetical protein n=1 Tax=Rothia sp. P7181 TaxID=3402663 RepID=UPI003AE15497